MIEELSMMIHHLRSCLGDIEDSLAILDVTSEKMEHFYREENEKEYYRLESASNKTRESMRASVEKLRTKIYDTELLVMSIYRSTNLNIQDMLKKLHCENKQ